MLIVHPLKVALPKRSLAFVDAFDSKVDWSSPACKEEHWFSNGAGGLHLARVSQHNLATW